jgi:hypothetical protein
MRHTADILGRRGASRIVVAIPVQLENGCGVTCDVSPSGINFETDRVFALGETIAFSLLLEHADPRGAIRFCCRGEIVRMERRHGRVRVAVGITASRLEPVLAPEH